ncbi:hypothetical protein [Haloarcula litorea]|uniref:hypothetical protein n=1 Tax=Haloarcula litorea TaxID=3032579 RepID=UPI0023E7D533|nr:hypothetical protein [Halomicroarcula sp. GDY20]
MPSASRRALLAASAGGLAALAGCDRLTGDQRRVEYTLDLRRLDRPLAEAIRWQPASNPDDPRRAVQREAWAAATAGEPYHTYGYPAVPDGTYTERDGTYYRLQDVITGKRTVERSVLRLRWVGPADAEETPEAVPREQLPPLDQRAVMGAYFAARAREHGGDAPWELVERGGYVYRHLDRAESALAPDPEHRHVSVHGTVLRVEVRRERLVEAEHTPAVTEVADDADAFAAVADAAAVEARLSPSEVSQAVRTTLTRARGSDGYTETLPLSERFEDALIAVEMREALSCSPAECDARVVETEYLAYDGDYFDCRLYVNVFE